MTEIRLHIWRCNNNSESNIVCTQQHNTSKSSVYCAILGQSLFVGSETLHLHSKCMQLRAGAMESADSGGPTVSVGARLKCDRVETVPWSCCLLPAPGKHSSHTQISGLSSHARTYVCQNFSNPVAFFVVGAGVDVC